jgi:hypothetical protein
MNTLMMTSCETRSEKLPGSVASSFPGSHSQLRLVRLRDAARYLGLDPHVFDRDVRPELTESRHGRAILFDRLELDAWADYTMARGRAPVRRTLWQNGIHQDLSREERSGTSRKRSKVTAGSMRAGRVGSSRSGALPSVSIRRDSKRPHLRRAAKHHVSRGSSEVYRRRCSFAVSASIGVAARYT